MADRIRYNLNVQSENGLYKRDINAQGRQVTLNAQGHVGGIIEAPTAANGTTIDLSGLDTLGWLYLRNLDASDDPNYVTWGVNDGGTLVPVGRLSPGEDAWLRLDPTVTIRLQADTLPVNVQYECFND